MNKGKQYELLIEATEFPGFGIGYYNGHKVNVKGALPGQKVLIRVSKQKKGYVEGKIIEILEEVPYRITPECPHFGNCGGCSHGHISLEKQLELKKQQILQLFCDGEIYEFDFLGIESSPEQWGYRNKMEYTFGDFEKGGELTLGMHIKEKSFGIVTVDNCKIVDSDYRIILSTVLNYFKDKNLPYYRVIPHEGFLRNLVVRKAKNTGEILINLVTTSQVAFDLTEFTELLKGLEYEGKLTGILHSVNDGLADMVQADTLEILYGKDFIEETLLGLKFKIRPFSFFQTNSRGAEKLYSIVRDFIGETSNKTVFDLYCGTGTIGQIVAPKAKKVIGIELIAEAVADAKENAKLNGLENTEFIAGDIAKVITEITEKPDIIILDPPRPGVHPFALDYVLKFNAPEIIYVSCNPKSLVNDLKVILEKGYSIEKVEAMDMFPGTPHVETVVKLERKLVINK